MIVVAILAGIILGTLLLAVARGPEPTPCRWCHQPKWLHDSVWDAERRVSERRCPGSKTTYAAELEGPKIKTGG